MGREKVERAIKLIAQLSIDKSSTAFSKFIKAGAKIEMEKAYMSDISEVTERINAENDETVGVLVDLEGDNPFKFLFFINLSDSFILTDMILRKEPGTTKEFDLNASSAVQEIGNILACATANVFSADFKIKLRPTPPIMVHDFAGTVFKEHIMTAATGKDEILIIESKFCVVKNNVKCHVFILPIQKSAEILKNVADIVIERGGK